MSCTPKEFTRFPPDWKVIPFLEAVKDITSGNKKLPKQEYLLKGKYPVVDQGQALFGGYTDEKTLVCKSSIPTIIFGDHTRAFKYIDVPFVLGADGAKVLEPKVESLDKRFLFHYLKQLNIESAGYSRHFKFLKETYVPIPPLEEQKRIAAILDKADAIRQKRKQAIDLADEFLRSVFLDMFGDPVTNPKGWEIDELLNHIQHANNGLSRRRKKEENIGDIVLRLQDVHYDGIRFDKALNRIELDNKERSRYCLFEGDLLFIRVNGNPDYVGRSAVFESYNEPVYHNDHIIRIRLNEKYNSRFLSYMFNLPGGRKIIASKIKTSAGQHTISQGGIESLVFYLPPRSLQDKFCEIQRLIYLQRKKFLDSTNEVEMAFSSLSQKAFSGQL